MSLINTLKRSKNIRKLFGKKEIIIIEKQLLGIKLKPSEKTRLSRDIRKKFDAVKELLPFSSEFNLKHGLIIKEIIEEAKETILETEYFSKIKRIYLYGSTADKTHLFRSDIDLAVEFDQISSKDSTIFKIKTHIPEKVQLEVFNTLPLKIQNEILNKGKIIYERKN